MHITMLITNADGDVVQCVIDSSNKADFEALGFVDHDSKIKKPKPKRTKVKINATQD